MKATRTINVLLLPCILMTSVRCDVTHTRDELQRIFEDVAMNGLHVQRIQDDVNLVDIDVADLDGLATISQLSDDLTEAFNDVFAAVTDIRAVTEHLLNYNSSHLPRLTSSNQTTVFVDGKPYHRCCQAGKGPLEFEPPYNTRIDEKTMCFRQSDDADNDVIIPLAADLQQVFEANSSPLIKWQYVGLEGGTFAKHPAAEDPEDRPCGSFDNRLRPWYAEAAAQDAKDIMLLIDTSESMAATLDLAKQAATVVIETLNANDRVGVIAFSNTVLPPPGDENEKCYSENLAFATYNVIQYLKSYVNGLQAKNRANHNAALETAFSFFRAAEAHPDDAKRRKGILLLTNDAPIKSDDIVSNIRSWNAEFNDSVLILTYGVGDGLTSRDQQILDQIAMATADNPGHFTWIEDANDLRLNLASYYSFFSSKQRVDTPIITPSYIDFSGLGHITSACLPVYTNTTDFAGVTCVDITIKDLTSSFTHFRNGFNAYAFIIDGSGRTLVHPRMPEPGSHYTARPLLVNIETLEPEAEQAGVIDRIKRGESGYQQLNILTLQDRGKANLHGVESRHTNATFYFTKIGNTGYSTCLVVTSEYQSLTLRTQQRDHNPVYHKLGPQEVDVCKHMDHKTMSESAVKLAPFAFSNPAVYEGDNETDVQIQHILNFLSGDTNTISSLQIRTGVREMVWFSKLMEQYWRESDIPMMHVHRYFFASLNGVTRMYPGSELPQSYDAPQQVWYIRARAAHPALTFTGPHQSEFTGQRVVTIARALKAGGRKQTVFGVAGMQVDLKFLLTSLTTSNCFTDNIQCYLIDDNGFVLYHPLYDDVTGSALVLSDVDEHASEYLLRHGHMTTQQCNDFSWRRRYLTYTIDLQNTVDRLDDEEGLYVSPVNGTNVYLVLRDTNKALNNRNLCPGTCLQQTYAHCDDLDIEQCNCPCFSSIRYHHCDNSFLASEHGTFSPCSVNTVTSQQSVSFVRIDSATANTSACFTYTCDVITDRWRCELTGTCQWNEKHGACAVKANDSASSSSSSSGSSTNVAAIVAPVVVLTVLLAAVAAFLLWRRRGHCKKPHVQRTNDNDPCYDTLHFEKLQKTDKITGGDVNHLDISSVYIDRVNAPPRPGNCKPLHPIIPPPAAFDNNAMVDEELPAPSGAVPRDEELPAPSDRVPRDEERPEPSEGITHDPADQNIAALSLGIPHVPSADYCNGIVGQLDDSYIGHDPKLSVASTSSNENENRNETVADEPWVASSALIEQSHEDKFTGDAHELLTLDEANQPIVDELESVYITAPVPPAVGVDGFQTQKTTSQITQLF